MEKPFECSASTEKLDSALAKAQGEFKAAVKDKVNPFFKSKYADLESVFDACRSALAKFEVAITQWPVDGGDERLHLITRVSHKGEWIVSRLAIPVGKQDPQGYKSAMTYARRMGIVSALGVAEEDDDGNQATQNMQKQGPIVKPPPPPAQKPKFQAPPSIQKLGNLRDRPDEPPFPEEEIPF